MEGGWKVDQERLMTGYGVSGPEITVSDDEQNRVDRKPVELPLAPYEDCAYVDNQISSRYTGLQANIG